MISLVVRERTAFVPSPGTQLSTGDHLLIAASDEHRAEAERRLRAVSRGGRLAAWYGEDGRDELESSPPLRPRSPTQRPLAHPTGTTRVPTAPSSASQIRPSSVITARPPVRSTNRTTA